MPANAMSFSSSPGRLPLRVHIRTPKIVIRPTVGILVDLHMTMAQIMDTALAFQDRFKKSEAEIIDVLSQPVDIIVSNAKSEGTDDAVRVQPSTTVREALMYEDMDRVLFEIIQKVRKKTMCPCAHSDRC